MTLLFPSINKNYRKNTKKPVIQVVKSVLVYSNITKKCLLCLHQKDKIINDPNSKELLNKASELVSNYRYAKNYSSNNYKGSA